MVPRLQSMKVLVDKINHEGQAIGTDIVKVDGFINHQLDIAFMEELGREFRRRFDEEEVDLILTVESSGIAIACTTAPSFGYAPVVFAKKTIPSAMTEDYYGAEARSFTKGTISMFRVAKKFINQENKVLIIDDFLAHGEAAHALAQIVEEAGAKVVGIGAVIDKAFQGGSKKLRDAGYRVESLAIVEKIDQILSLVFLR